MINSVFLGIDQIEIDDSYFSFFRLTKKMMKYVNISKKWIFYQDQSYYSINDVVPVIIFEIQLGESGVYNKRLAYNIYEVLALIGGQAWVKLLLLQWYSLLNFLGPVKLWHKLLTTFVPQSKKTSNLSNLTSLGSKSNY